MVSTEPVTMSGLGLRGALKKARTMPDPEVDWGAWIADIEQEATAIQARQIAELREALHKRLGYEGEGVGVWVHRAEPDGMAGQQRETFYTFRVEDVHALVDDALATTERLTPADESEPSLDETIEAEITATKQCPHCDGDSAYDRGRIDALRWVAIKVRELHSERKP